MHDLEPLLAEHPFFQGLSANFLALLAGCATNVRFDAGEYLFHEGEEANRFYLIRDGGVLVQVFVPGRGAVTLQTLRGGDVLGWSWLIAPYRWRFDARAMEPTRALALDGVCLRGKCDENHHLGYEMLKRFAAIVAERLEATRLQLLDVYGPKG